MAIGWEKINTKKSIEQCFWIREEKKITGDAMEWILVWSNPQNRINKLNLTKLRGKNRIAFEKSLNACNW